MAFLLSKLLFSRKSALAASLSCALGCASQPPAASPFSVAETNQALAPAGRLRPRCYDGSALARAKRRIVLDFALEVKASGAVRATPTFAEPADPEVIECVRHELDTIRFPARGRDRLVLHFEMGH